MSRWPRAQLFAFALSLLLSLPAVAQVAGGQSERDSERDPRGVVLLDFRCGNTLGSRQITLFLNGTVRLRRAYQEKKSMHLAELGPDELGRYLARLRKVDAVSDTFGLSLESSTEGSWVEQCSLLLALPSRQEETFHFSRLDLTPLRATQLIQVAEELAEKALPVLRAKGLPSRYQPRIGDVLRTSEGQRYRVVGWTTDEQGVVLDGLDSPLRMYVALGDMRHSFVAVDERGRGSSSPGGER